MVGSRMTLTNPMLEGVDPFDPMLSLEHKGMILEECRVNPQYFLDAICRVIPIENRNYENLVREILVTIQHQVRYPEKRKPIYVYIRKDNMPHFMAEFKAQSSVVHPDLNINNWGVFQAYWERLGLNIHVCYQVVLTEANNYVRYESKEDCTIYADYGG
jgi:hypothetical protein